MVSILCMIGIVMVFSASYASAYYKYGNSYYFVQDQLIWLILGVIVMFVMAFMSTPKFLKVIAIPSLVVAVGLLALVPFIGVVRNDAKRWLKFGPISIQPSEIAKIAIILSFAYLITRSGEKIKTFRYGILPYVGILGVVGFLLIKQPHYSATILIFAVGGAMLIVGGINLKWVAGLAAVVIPAAAIIFMKSSYALSRIQRWLDPWSDPLGKGYQTIQSLYAVGSGGLFGLGLGKSRQKQLYLPEPQNDFIFAIVCEELGLIGALIILLLFVALVWRGFLIAFRAPDRFSALVVMGIMVKLGLQVVLNVAVVTNLMPNTGISLPFFSAGGSALLVQMFEMGIVLGVSRYSRSGG